MANKARYYGIATREEKQDVTRKDNAALIYPNALGYSAVVTAILNYKKNHPNFDNLSTSIAADRIAGELTKTGLYGTVTGSGSRIEGGGYSIALTKGKGTGSMITASKASERTSESERRKKKR